MITMKWKLAVILGICSYIFVYIFSNLFYAPIAWRIPFFEGSSAIIMIISSLIFGIIFIRESDGNKQIMGFLGGCVFFIIDLIIDIISILNQLNNSPIEIYPYHVLYSFIIFVGVLTALGYMANFEVKLE